MVNHANLKPVAANNYRLFYGEIQIHKSLFNDLSAEESQPQTKFPVIALNPHGIYCNKAVYIYINIKKCK